MKILIFLSTFLFFIFSLKAQTNFINAETAAKNFLKNKSKNKTSIIYSNAIIANNIALCYLFELSPAGFILISSNTNLPPVLAYSWESNFGELNFSNPLYSLAISNLQNHSFQSKQYNVDWNNLLNQNKTTDTTFQQWPDIGDGWLKTNWTQNAPYDNFCPIDPVTSQRSIAGCPSIAMAMILNFHNSTNNTHFDNSDDYYHNYAGRQYWIDNDYLARGFPSFTQLNSYLDTLNDHYTNSVLLTNNDKAALVFACGVAAQQVYTSSGSGTFGVNQAYDAYQRFNCTTATLLDTTHVDLFPRLIQNMKDTLPAHLAIVDPSWSSGHNVVIDGYNTDNYFHLNFGWGGSYNGWYLIPQEIPYSLTVIEGVVLDIFKSQSTNYSILNNEIFTLNIFPNPSTNKQFTISIKSNDNNIISIKIMNIQGIQFYSKEYVKSAEFLNIQFDTENLTNGYYIIECCIGNRVIRKPLIIQ